MAKQYSKTIAELKEMAAKAHAAGNEALVAAISKIALKQHAEMKQAAAEEAQVAEDRAAFVEHTPSMTPMDDIRDGLYEGVQGAVDQMGNKIASIEAERQSVPTQDRIPLMAASAMNQYMTDDGTTAPRSPEEAALFMAGEAVAPAAGGALMEYGNAALEVIGNVTPDAIEKPTVEAVKGVVFDIGQSEAWKGFTAALEGGWEDAKEFLDLNPRNARQLSSIANIAAFKGKKPPSTAVALRGKELSIFGAQGKRSKRDEGIFKMMMPDRKDMYKSDRGTSTTSKSGVITWTPTKIEAERLLELKKVPQLDPLSPVGYNVDKVYEQINTLNDRVIENIYAAGNPEIIRKFVMDKLDSDVEGLVLSNGWQAINGAQSQVTPLMSHLKDLIQRSDGTTAGLLQVRKDFDTFIKEWKPADIEGGLVNSRSQIVKLARGVLNKEVAAMIPDRASQGLLTRQSRLYQNLNVMEPRAATELLGVFGKVQNIVRDKTGITIPKTPASIAGNVLLLGGLAAQPWMPMVATSLAVAGSGALAINTLRSPAIRSYAGASLTALSKVMAKTTDPIKLNLYKADRAVLIHYLNTPADTSEEEVPAM